MAYLQELLQSQSEQNRQVQVTSSQLGLPLGQAYTSYFPTWEVTAPQYQVPQAWSLSQLGYKTNEVAYACISLKMKTISEPRLRIWDKVEEEFIDDGDNEEFFRFMEQPCPDVSETDFHSANQMYLDIAGFMGWEKDTTNSGGLKAIWPIMPQYASFKRGQGQLLAYIHYLPYTGLPAYDIPRNRVVLMMYADPQYFGLKPLSPTAVMADIIKVDNDMTTMIQQFIKNAGFLSGLLKTEQVINDADAKFAKERWRETHGGPQNAGEIAVLGKGLEFQTSNNTFREMVFPEVDARSETRICMGYSVPPILVSAKSGMDRATYSNYEQARKAWYEEYVTSQWKFLAERYTKDIFPHFDPDVNHILKFDTKEVKALQEDRNSQWDRAREAYKARIIPRNGALTEMGLPQLSDSDEILGNEYYLNTVVTTSTQIQDNLDEPSVEKVDEENKIVADDNNKDIGKSESDDEKDEEKKFRAFAKRRLKEGKDKDIPEYEFLYLSQKRQRQLLSEYNVPDPDAKMVLDGLLALAEVMKSSKSIVQTSEQRTPNINITANIEAGKTPDVKIDNIIPEQKALEVPSVTVEVSPTPVNIENKIDVKPADVHIPKPKREYQKVKRDMGNNIEGTITEIVYEGDENA
jgi:phage portal protein BeeE